MVNVMNHPEEFIGSPMQHRDVVRAARIVEFAITDQHRSEHPEDFKHILDQYVVV